MNTIHVLHVVSIMDMGGLETFIMNVYRNIDRNKVQFDFLVHQEKEGDYDKEIISLGGKIYKIPYVNEVGPIKYPHLLRNFFTNHKEYEIVHSHMNLISGIILREAKKSGVKHTIAHSHSTNHLGKFYEKIYKNLSGLYVNKYSDYKFACSREAAQYVFKEEGARDCKIIKNGIDLNRFKVDREKLEILRSELKLDENTFVVGNVSRFSKVKNHEFMIDIFNEVSKKVENAKLILVGDGILQNDIRNKVSSKGLDDKVLFMGRREDVPEIMHLFDVFLLPSYFEGLGIVLIEAQACGVKCVVSDLVPKEADMDLGLIKYLSLESPKKHWVEEISKPYYEVKNIQEKIQSKGYDINSTVTFLQDFYENLLK